MEVWGESENRFARIQFDPHKINWATQIPTNVYLWNLVKASLWVTSSNPTLAKLSLLTCLILNIAQSSFKMSWKCWCMDKAKYSQIFLEILTFMAKFPEIRKCWHSLINFPKSEIFLHLCQNRRKGCLLPKACAKAVRVEYTTTGHLTAGSQVIRVQVYTGYRALWTHLKCCMQPGEKNVGLTKTC